MTWYVYILQCCDGSYYTGLTQNVEDRLKRHNAGIGAVYTKQRRPVYLKFVEKFTSLQVARLRESAIKKLGVKGKSNLIRSNSFNVNVK